MIYSTIGVEYQYQRWIELWPPIIDGLLDAAEATGSRLIFADNLYSYGPQTIPLREDLPMTVYGKKPALRARLTHNNSGSATAAELRAVDAQTVNQTGTSGARVGRLVGVRGAVNNAASAFANKAVGVEATIANETGGNVNEAAAFEVAPPTNTGTIFDLVRVACAGFD
ncbi:MAG: hypothetical protein HC897_08165, partial [Thermoanaerobaculia bacterium]|nr:hypothetical protein [Thermoanaerobaculia bacterium]